MIPKTQNLSYKRFGEKLIPRYQTGNVIRTTSGSGYVPNNWGYNLAVDNPSNTSKTSNGGYAIYVNFPEHKIGLKDGAEGLMGDVLNYLYDSGIKYAPFKGHAAIITVDPNRRTRYYQYGRYPDGSASNIGKTTNTDGNYQRIRIPDMNSEYDFQKFADLLSEQFKEPLELVIVPDVNVDDVHSYIESDMNNVDREDYSLLDNNCATKACDIISKGNPKFKETSLINTPSSIANNLEKAKYKRYKSKKK